jgi:3-phosphoshikimate 1-carboxyvinyltransferase
MHINAQQYNGQLSAPASKSHGQRLLLLSLITSNPFEIQQLGSDNDSRAMQAAVKSIKAQPNKEIFKTITVAESGFALRTLALVGAGFYEHYLLSGSGTLLKRQHWATIKLLEQLGLEVTHQNGYLPLEVKGQITNTQLVIDGSEGSQYVSGLFFLAAKHPGTWQIEIQHLNSQPYFDLTLQTLELAGFTYQKKEDTYYFSGAQELKPNVGIVEGAERFGFKP